MLTGIRAITLDLDDTLWDIDSVIVNAEQRLFEWLSEHFPRVTERHSLADMRAVRFGFHQRHPELHHDLSELRRRALRWHADDAGYESASVLRGFDVYYAARNEVSLYADVLPALERLAERYPLLALTNGNADLGRIGIDHLFDGTVYAAAVKQTKPHPDMFHTAARSLGVPVAETLHIGDDPHTDVQGARDAGARAVWVNRKGAPWPAELSRPEFEVADLAVLVDRLG